MSSPLIRVKGLKKYFPIRGGLLSRTVNQVQAVDGIDLDIEKGKTLGLVGESGCGKTTVGRTILRLTDPTAGSVTFAGQEIGGAPHAVVRDLRPRMQIVFQDPMSSLNPRMPVSQILAEPLKLNVGSVLETSAERAVAARVLREARVWTWVAAATIAISFTVGAMTFPALKTAGIFTVSSLRVSVFDLGFGIVAALLATATGLNVQRFEAPIRSRGFAIATIAWGTWRGWSLITAGTPTSAPFGIPPGIWVGALLATYIALIAIGVWLILITTRSDARAIFQAKPKRVDARVTRLLQKVGLRPEHAGRFPHEFSGGQRQRIGVARALALNPDFIVLDEPTSALDVSVQAQVLNLLKHLQKDLDLTYLFISHDLSVVRHLCDEVAVMYLGRIVERGPVKEVFERPQHPYTQALLSAVPVPDPTIKANRIILTGDVPSPVNPPAACRFNPRCPRAQDICRDVDPPLELKLPQQLAACHFPGEASKWPVTQPGKTQGTTARV